MTGRRSVSVRVTILPYFTVLRHVLSEPNVVRQLIQLVANNIVNLLFSNRTILFFTCTARAVIFSSCALRTPIIILIICRKINLNTVHNKRYCYSRAEFTRYCVWWSYQWLKIARPILTIVFGSNDGLVCRYIIIINSLFLYSFCRLVNYSNAIEAIAWRYTGNIFKRKHCFSVANTF